jgi:hypothetical protein
MIRVGASVKTAVWSRHTVRRGLQASGTACDKQVWLPNPATVSQLHTSPDLATRKAELDLALSRSTPEMVLITSQTAITDHYCAA